MRDARRVAAALYAAAVALLRTRPGAVHAVYVDHEPASDLSGFGYQEVAEARERAAGQVQAAVADTATRAGITWTFERRLGWPFPDRAGLPRQFLSETLMSTLFAVADMSLAWVATMTGLSAMSVDPSPTCPRAPTPHA
jgi:hypothetical protein